MVQGNMTKIFEPVLEVHVEKIAPRVPKHHLNPGDLIWLRHAPGFPPTLYKVIKDGDPILVFVICQPMAPDTENTEKWIGKWVFDSLEAVILRTMSGLK